MAICDEPHGKPSQEGDAVAEGQGGNDDADAAATAPPATPRPPVARLPVEMLLAIAGNLTTTGELNALARTCRGLYNVLDPLVYRQGVKEKNDDAVLWACEHNSVATLERLREQGAKFDFEVEREPRRHPNNLPTCFAPIHVAAKHGHVDVLAWLLDNGVNIDALSYEFCGCGCFSRRIWTRTTEVRNLSPLAPQWTALHTAVCCGNTDAAILLLERGASLTVSQRKEDHVRPAWCSQDSDTNITVMHTAAAANNVALIDYIVERDLADLDCIDSAGSAPFHYAAQGAHTGGALARIHQLLWPREKLYWGRLTPFQLATGTGAFGSALILLRGGHELSNEDSAKDPLLSRAAGAYPSYWWPSTLSAWVQQRDAFVAELLARGHRANVLHHGYEPLLCAFAALPPQQTTPSLFRALLTTGGADADVDTPNHHGTTPLCLITKGLNDASVVGDRDAASFRAKLCLLLDHGATLTPAALDALLLGTGSRLPGWRVDLAHAVIDRAFDRAADKDDSESAGHEQALTSALGGLLGECVEQGRVSACEVLVEQGAVYRVLGRGVMIGLVRRGEAEVLEALAVCVGGEEVEGLVREAERGAVGLGGSGGWDLGDA
ncbi:ankyrin repeat-containing domain protein [Parachaetomium inaequale]|uniref:Ankyrin repeat-containing domain protein n=1 Tax=Parachaetomium inaequale TaxID=2588326 RepID=A0AAN6PLQ7_9PEZI|nr:ankyrin repeat-containing domain protein [Parachaetomium inaequale]